MNKHDGYSQIHASKRGFKRVCDKTSQSVVEIRNQQLSHSLLATAKADQSLEVGYAYSPYGQTQKLGVENQQIGSENNSQYTGRENDQNGLYYYRARYYDPVLKRFISEDPIGLAGGLNSHAYVEGNPVSFTDPLGLSKGGKQNIGTEGLNKQSKPEDVQKRLDEAKKAGQAERIKKLRGLLKVIKRGGSMCLVFLCPLCDILLITTAPEEPS